MDHTKHYPSRRYHPELGDKLVHSAEEDQALGAEWFHSPAEFGVETCPGKSPDPVILAKKAAFEKKRQQAAQDLMRAESVASENLDAAVSSMLKKRGRPSKGGAA